jgi:hypothetical protein
MDYGNIIYILALATFAAIIGFGVLSYVRTKRKTDHRDHDAQAETVRRER